MKKFLLIIFFIKYIIDIEYVKFPIDRDYTHKNELIFTELFESKLYINLTLGSHKQKVPFYLYFKDYATYIAGPETLAEKVWYNVYKSKNYVNNKEVEFESNRLITNDNSNGYKFKKGINSTDVININNKKYQFNFFYVSEFDLNMPSYNVIGLKSTNHYAEKHDVGYYNFINQFKNLNLIDSYIFTLSFDKNDFFYNKGIFTLGTFPHIYDNKHFDLKNQKRKKIDLRYNSQKWLFSFDEIHFCNSVNSIHTYVEIQIEFNLIASSDIYYNIAKGNWFDNLISQNKCKEEVIKDYRVFSCDYNEDIIKQFDNFKIVDKGENFIFEFTYKELFKLINGRYYFLIIFNKQISGFILGKIFLQKYQITFNQDSKMIYWYEGYVNFDNNNINKINKVNIVLNIFFILIIIIMAFIIYKIIKNLPRKKRINELDSEYDYKEYNDSNKDKNDNNIKIELKKNKLIL